MGSVSAPFVRRVLHSHADRVTALPPERAAEEVAWVWTVQEACVKAGGAGLSGRPWAIDVRPGSRHGHWGVYRWISLRDRSRTPFSCAFSARPAATAAAAPAAPPAPCACGSETSGRTPTSDKDRP